MYNEGLVVFRLYDVFILHIITQEGTGRKSEGCIAAVFNVMYDTGRESSNTSELIKRL